MREAYIEVNDIILDIDFLDTVTARLIYDQLPFTGNIQKWGDEIYFDVPFSNIELEFGAREVMEIGEIGYWVEGSSVAIFFGPTPASHNNESRAVTPINVFAMIIGDSTRLASVKDGDFILFGR